MVVVNGKSPKIYSVYPESRPEKAPGRIYLSGEGLEASTSVSVGGVACPTVSLLPDGRLECTLATSIPPGESPVVASNTPYDSKPYPFEITSITPQSGDQYPSADPRIQPFVASYIGRSDSQRIPAGQQFTGELPDAEQGNVGDVTGPTKGGYWHYNQRTRITEIEWYSVGEEPSDRGAGSGIFVGRENGGETLLIDLANTRFAAYVTDEINLNKGDYIKIVTVGATLEMMANVRHIASNRSISR